MHLYAVIIWYPCPGEVKFEFYISLSSFPWWWHVQPDPSPFLILFPFSPSMTAHHRSVLVEVEEETEQGISRQHSSAHPHTETVSPVQQYLGTILTSLDAQRRQQWQCHTHQPWAGTDGGWSGYESRSILGGSVKACSPEGELTVAYYGNVVPLIRARLRMSLFLWCSMCFWSLLEQPYTRSRSVVKLLSVRGTIWVYNIGDEETLMLCSPAWYWQKWRGEFGCVACEWRVRRPFLTICNNFIWFQPSHSLVWWFFRCFYPFACRKI